METTKVQKEIIPARTQYIFNQEDLLAILFEHVNNRKPSDDEIDRCVIWINERPDRVTLRVEE